MELIQEALSNIVDYSVRMADIPLNTNNKKNVRSRTNCSVKVTQNNSKKTGNIPMVRYKPPLADREACNELGVILGLVSIFWISSKLLIASVQALIGFRFMPSWLMFAFSSVLGALQRLITPLLAFFAITVLNKVLSEKTSR